MKKLKRFAVWVALSLLIWFVLGLAEREISTLFLATQPDLTDLDSGMFPGLAGFTAVLIVGYLHKKKVKFFADDGWRDTEEWTKPWVAGLVLAFFVIAQLMAWDFYSTASLENFSVKESLFTAEKVYTYEDISYVYIYTYNEAGQKAHKDDWCYEIVLKDGNSIDLDFMKIWKSEYKEELQVVLEIDRKVRRANIQRRVDTTGAQAIIDKYIQSGDIENAKRLKELYFTESENITLSY